MGSRAAHNWKRRQKLLEKHGSAKGGGKASGKDKDKGKGKTNKGGRVSASRDKKKVSREIPKSTSDKGTKVAKIKAGKRKLKARITQQAEEEGAAKKAKLRIRMSPEPKKARKKLPGDRKLKLKKLVSTDRKGKTGKTLKTPKLRKVSKSKIKKPFLRQTARVVCPGSLTERFIACGKATSQSALTAFERGLLATGPLSWRWLRDQDEDLLPHKMRPIEADYDGQQQAMRKASELKTAKDAERLRQVDTMLEKDAMWPPCAARVALADRLHQPKALKRRCERYLKEAIVPLADDAVLKAASTETSSSQALKQAHQLVTSCAHAWMEAAWNQPAEGLGQAALHRAWLHMLRRSLDLEDKECPSGWSSWLATLRQVQLARLCPCLDDEAQMRLLRSIVLLLPAMEPAEKDPLVVPLGLFTFWQGLALVALARRQGRHALVVRRHAAGAPEVLFRSASVVLSAS
eukprot:Skav234699  [mRNA]  locus=scaffold3643:201595:202977:- [translate_table: standard]